MSAYRFNQTVPLVVVKTNRVDLDLELQEDNTHHIEKHHRCHVLQLDSIPVEFSEHFQISIGTGLPFQGYMDLVCLNCYIITVLFGEVSTWGSP